MQWFEFQLNDIVLSYQKLFSKSSSKELLKGFIVLR